MSTIQNDTRIHTLTETLRAEEVGYTPLQPVQEYVWPSGGEQLEPPSANAQEAPRLSAEREGRIRNRLAEVIATGRELKIQALFVRIQAANVSQETKKQLEDWMKEFSAFALQDEKQRSTSLAVLVLKVIRSSKELCALEKDVCEILQQMGKPVDTFLQEIEIGLLREELFEEGCRRLEAIAQTVARAEELARQQIDAQLEQACNRIKERLRLFQLMRRQVYTGLQAYITALVQEVEQLRRELLQQVDEMERIGRQDASLFKQQEVLLTELEKFLRGII
jgi:hypothetical protein